MARLPIIILIFNSFFSSCFSQTEEQKKNVEDTIKTALKKWFENPTINKELLDPNLIKQLQDSGHTDNGVKEGIWVQYSLDTSLMGQQTTFEFDGKQVTMNGDATLQKEVGNYSKGKKQSIWTCYKSYEKKLPLYWIKKSETNYEYGQKNGKEIFFSGAYGSDTILVRTFINGQEQSGKIFDTNYPNKLQQTYTVIDGQTWLMEAYYPSGQLQTKYIDTVINGNQLKFFKEYFEDGQLKMTGYYLKGEQRFGTWTYFYKNGKTENINNYIDGKLNGSYKYFHDNGQLWTERIYKDGKLWEVISNYNRKGEKNNSGTIKNGSGTLYIYDTDGKLTDQVEYVDGQEKK